MNIPTPRHGANGDYLLYTVDHVPFSDVRAYMDGGPPLVVLDDWAVSSSFPNGDDDNPVTLNARTIGEDMTRHPLHGTRYPTCRDADEAAFNAGLLAFMVYTHEAAQHGLPTGGC